LLKTTILIALYYISNVPGKELYVTMYALIRDTLHIPASIT